MKFLKYFLLATLIHGYPSCSMGQTVDRTIEANYAWGLNSETNLVKNPSAAKNRQYALAVGITLTRDTSAGKKIDNKASWLIDGTALNDYQEFELNTPPDDLTSGMCVFKGEFIGDASMYSAQILDGSANVLSSVALTNETTWRGFAVPYACGASGARKVRVTQTTAGNGAAFNAGKFTYTRYVPIAAQLPNRFTARVETTTGSSQLSGLSDWVSCTADSPSVCTLKSGLFTESPNCGAETLSTSPTNTVSVSGTGVSTRTIYFNGATIATFWCEKQGSDYQPTVIMPDETADLLGTVFYYAGATCPRGSLPANSTAVSRTTYSKLFARIGTTFGSGNGSTTFNVPNAQGVFIRSTGSQTIGAETYTGGALGAKQNDATSKNGLTLNDPGHTHGYLHGVWGSGAYAYSAQANLMSTMTTNPAYTGVTISTVDSETRPGNISLTPCIWHVSSNALMLNGSYTNPNPISLKSGSVTLWCSAASTKYRDKLGLSIANAVDNGTNRSCVVTFDKDWGDHPDCSFTYAGTDDMKPVGIRSGGVSPSSLTIVGPDEDFLGILKCEGVW